MTSCRREVGRRSLREEAKECRENGYLLSAKKIGTGAFSKVYLGYATHEKVNQNYKLASDLGAKQHNMVAVKVVSTAEAPAEYCRKFLYREIYALNVTYKHRNVIQLYETFKNGKRSYLILELASRGDLLEHINAVSARKETPGLEEEDARKLFRQIISAVAHCHNNCIVHRDLKCENILLDDRGFVKLTDFGFANKYSGKKALLSTFCGSVAYTAPEILLARKYNGEQVDFWSLGVILYAMVMGRLPYSERHPRKLVQVIRHGLRFHHPVSQECEDLIRGLLQWKPSARLNLQQVSMHCWLLPATSTILQRLWSSAFDSVDSDKAQEKKIQQKSISTPTNRRRPHTAKESERFSRRSILKPTVCSLRYTVVPMRVEPETEKKAEPFLRNSGTSSVGRVQMQTTSQAESSSEESISDANRLFIRRPKPPPTLKPFHNIPHFHKPGLDYSHNSRATTVLQNMGELPGSTENFSASQRVISHNEVALTEACELRRQRPQQTNL